MTKEKTRFFIRTFGCQMNVNDSEKIAGLLAAEGHEPVSDLAAADFVFINTCAVREKAASKLYHALSRLKKAKGERPDLRIGVGGCVAQLEGEQILKRAPQVDVLVGSAYVTAMEGCNHVCSFCVVPRTRGPEVNRPPSQIVGEVTGLVERGYSEVMLLGQTVNAYRYGDLDFADLLGLVNAVPGLRRLRFTTSHPEHVSVRLADALRDLDKVCPHLHLPVQSGSDRVLRSMRRGYGARQYVETAELLRDRVRDLALTSDIIVGYPGETDEDFQETLSLVEQVGFDGLFVFTYSPRPGTGAQRLADDVPDAEKSRRLGVLNDYQQRVQRARNQVRLGSREEVLVDAAFERGRVAGRTPHFRIVHLEGDRQLLGRTVEAEIVGAGANSLVGRLPQAIH